MSIFGGIFCVIDIVLSVDCATGVADLSVELGMLWRG